MIASIHKFFQFIFSIRRDLVVGDHSRCSDFFLVSLVTSIKTNGWITWFRGRFPWCGVGDKFLLPTVTSLRTGFGSNEIWSWNFTEIRSQFSQTELIIHLETRIVLDWQCWIPNAAMSISDKEIWELTYNVNTQTPKSVTKSKMSELKL